MPKYMLTIISNMHIMLKRTLIFLVLAVIIGGFALSNFFPDTTIMATGLSLLCVILAMFCAVGYSVRGED